MTIGHINGIPVRCQRQKMKALNVLRKNKGNWMSVDEIREKMVNCDKEPIENSIYYFYYMPIALNGGRIEVSDSPKPMFRYMERYM